MKAWNFKGVIRNHCKCNFEMNIFKQMEKKDFEHMNMFLQNKDIDPTTKASNFEYWKKRINGRIEYLTPLMDECIKKGIDIATLSKELHEEWIELHEHKRFYNF
jgi:hypothetical protein